MSSVVPTVVFLFVCHLLVSGRDRGGEKASRNVSEPSPRANLLRSTNSQHAPNQQNTELNQLIKGYPNCSKVKINGCSSDRDLSVLLGGSLFSDLWRLDLPDLLAGCSFLGSTLIFFSFVTGVQRWFTWISAMI